MGLEILEIKLPPELELKRDELAYQYAKETFGDGYEDMTSDWKSGFDVAVALMQPMIEAIEQCNLKELTPEQIKAASFDLIGKKNYEIKELKEREKIAIEALSDTSSWLHRMSDLKWNDKSYAPKFKAAYVRLTEALAKLRGKSD